MWRTFLLSEIKCGVPLLVLSEDWQSEFIAKKHTIHAAQIRKHVVNGGVDGPQQSIQLYSALSRKQNAGGAVRLGGQTD